MPLTPEFKAKTIAALRSGQYTQRRGAIGSFNILQLCCIGVAAHANGLGDAVTTGVAAEYVGLTKEERDEWVEWNDDRGLTFGRISHLIEDKY